MINLQRENSAAISTQVGGYLMQEDNAKILQALKGMRRIFKDWLFLHLYSVRIVRVQLDCVVSYIMILFVNKTAVYWVKEKN